MVGLAPDLLVLHDGHFPLIRDVVVGLQKPLGLAVIGPACKLEEPGRGTRMKKQESLEALLLYESLEGLKC